MDVTIDISGFTAEVDQTLTKDIPYATALSLTRVAQDGQIEVKREVGKLFTLRNTWTQSGIKITPADKGGFPIQSEVFTDTGNAAAPDYLLGQEDGSMKVPHEGHSHIAVPTKVLRYLIGEAAVIPDALRPKELLSDFDAMHTSRYKKTLVKTRPSQQYVGWKMNYKGRDYIFARKANDNRAPALPLYILIPETQVRAVLGMEETVDKIANERFEVHWEDAWDSIRG